MNARADGLARPSARAHKGFQLDAGDARVGAAPSLRLLAQLARQASAPTPPRRSLVWSVVESTGETLKSLRAGEYPVHTGFGWTNGVAQAFLGDDVCLPVLETRHNST